MYLITGYKELKTLLSLYNIFKQVNKNCNATITPQPPADCALQIVNSGNQNLMQMQQQQQLIPLANATNIPSLHSTILKNSNVGISNYEASDDVGLSAQPKPSHGLIQGKKCSVQSVSNQNNSAPVYVCVKTINSRCADLIKNLFHSIRKKK